jgi:hypothetical protein
LLSCRLPLPLSNCSFLPRSILEGDFYVVVLDGSLAGRTYPVDPNMVLSARVAESWKDVWMSNVPHSSLDVSHCPSKARMAEGIFLFLGKVHVY